MDQDKFIHGGNIHNFLRKTSAEAKVLDFSANINPLGLSFQVKNTILNSIAEIIHYPDPACYSLKKTIAEFYQINKKKIIIGNGAVELLYILCHVLRPKQALILAPSFSEYERAARAAHSKINYFYLSEQDNFLFPTETLIKKLKNIDLCFIGNPNNPTGNLLTIEEIEKIIIAAKKENCYIVLDESFIDFVKNDSLYTARSLLDKFENLILLQSLTKFYAIPGLRLGFAAMSEQLIKKLELAKDPWNVNVLAQKAGIAGLKDIEYQIKTKQFVQKSKDSFFHQLANISNLKIYNPSVNFILLKILNETMEAQHLKTLLMKKNILIRDCSNYPGLNNFFVRIAVKSEAENQILLREIKTIFEARR